LYEPLIKKVIKVMQFLSAETEKAFSGETYLFEILHFQEFNIPSLEIARLSVEIANKNFNERQTSWREELSKLASKKQEDLFEQHTTGAALNNFSKTIEHLIIGCLNQTPQQTIHQILRDCGILATALTHQEKTWFMEMLHTFFDFIKEECAKTPTHSMKSLTDTVLLMQENKIPLAAEKIVYSASGVNFITTHSSKGLEFDYVYIIGCNSKPWDENARNKSYKLPDNLFAIQGDEIEEVRRLFYVAMTRAKTHLQMSFSEQDLNQKALEPSRFIAEITEDKVIPITHELASNEEIIAFTLSPIDKKEEATIPTAIIDNAFTDSLLEKYSLSVTHLNSYLKCPVSFYFNNFIKVPSPKSASMTFGSAVHYALEQLFKKMNGDEEKQFSGIDQLLKDFKWYMRRKQDSFTEAEFKRRVEYGEEILPRYYDEYIHQWNKVTSVERSYKNVLVQGIPLNGKIDKMEFDGNFVNVVDYKTGSFKKAKPKFERPDPIGVNKAIVAGKEPSFEDEFGGDYWRQAVFYKLLMDYDATKKWEMRSSEFDFIEPLVQPGLKGKNDYKFHKEKIEITPEDLKIVESQIKMVYQKITQKEFTKGCGKEDCLWCNFTRDYYTSTKQKLGSGNWDQTENMEE
jgi:DNA helicase-2/ATP-dependent DNA helicase PcrA